MERRGGGNEKQREEKKGIFLEGDRHERISTPKKVA